VTGPPVKLTESLETAGFDEIIDVRSPAEFAADHLPGAINLPVLDDDERALVGTIYKQKSTFKARKTGAALISRNIARHIEAHFASKEGEYQPLIYCWRGGQRSGSMSSVLSQIGWRVTLLKGGYKTYRTSVIEQLYHGTPWFDVKVVAGLTGTAKTRLLHILEAQGEQMIDLEGLARHRGSLLGADPKQPQPTQKAFESALLAALRRVPSGAQIWVEAESSKIGEIFVPPLMWLAMADASAIEISAPISARVKHLCSEYEHFFEDGERLAALLEKLIPLHGHDRIDEWKSLIEQQAWAELVRALLEDHYDPAYRRSMEKNRRVTEKPYELEDLSDQALADCAAEISALKVAA